MSVERFEVGDPVVYPAVETPWGLTRREGVVAGIVRGEGMELVAVRITTGGWPGVDVQFVVDGAPAAIQRKVVV